MVPQVALPFKYEISSTSGATALAGLPLYLELAHVLGLRTALTELLPLRSAAPDWPDADLCMDLILLNLAGGDCVTDLDLLRRDEGFQKVARAVACVGLKRRARRAKERVLEKAGPVAMAGEMTFRRFLESFHGSDQDIERVVGTAAFVPEHARLKALWQVNRYLLTKLQALRPLKIMTLDADATLVETTKAEALHCYKGYKAYQPLNFYAFEWGTTVYSHFRDGNVPCGYKQLAALEQALALVPDGVQTVRLRMDTQGYEWELLRYLAEGKNKRFGTIEFCVGADMTQELRSEIKKLQPKAWQELARPAGKVAQQWAEVPFVPGASALKKDGPNYRFIVTREVLQQPALPGVAVELPFPVMEFEGVGQTKIHAMVTNRTGDAAALLQWYRQRCGKSEEAHSVMKSDLAGGQLPSKYFGANAAWWTIMQIALNLNEMFKKLALDASWATARLKKVRAHIVGVAGRVVEHARQVVIRLSDGHPSSKLIETARERILALFPAPTG